jgi:hypothetical protein
MSERLVWLWVRWPSVLLTMLGLTMLGLGVFVEDTDAVAVTLVVLGPLIVVVGMLLELFAPRLLRLALSQSSVTLELSAPLSADELEQAGLPEGVADALEQWLEDVTRILPIDIERRINEALDERERRASGTWQAVSRSPAALAAVRLIGLSK